MIAASSLVRIGNLSYIASHVDHSTTLGIRALRTYCLRPTCGGFQTDINVQELPETGSNNPFLSIE